MDRERALEKDEIWELLKHPPYLPFIQCDKSVVDKVESSVDLIEEFVWLGWKMKSEHDDHVKILYEELKEQQALIHNLNECTTPLMHTLQGTASKIQTINDTFIFHTDQSVDVARAVH